MAARNEQALRDAQDKIDKLELRIKFRDILVDSKEDATNGVCDRMGQLADKLVDAVFENIQN